MTDMSSHSGVAHPQRRCFISLKSYTWETESHDLYDYESRRVIEKHFKILGKECGYCIVRNHSDISIVADDDVENFMSDYPKAVCLIRLLQIDGEFYLSAQGCGNGVTKLWLVVRSVKNSAADVEKGNAFKFGRFRVYVKDIIHNDNERKDAMMNGTFTYGTRVTTNNASDAFSDVGTFVSDTGSELGNFDDNRTEIPDVSQPKGSSPVNKDQDKVETLKKDDGCENNCRICLCDDNETDNPLICACLCKGSMKLIHLECLRKWMEGRLRTADEAKEAFFWRNLSCELCKAQYPVYVENKDREPFELFQVPQPTYPYIVLEPHKAKEPGVYIVGLSGNNRLRLGRGHGTELRVTDISVSRQHAIMKHTKNGVVLIDNESKFGSIKSMKLPFKIDFGGPRFSFQFGRTVISFRNKRRFSFFPLCMGPLQSESDVTLVEHRIPSPERKVGKAKKKSIHGSSIDRLESRTLNRRPSNADIHVESSLPSHSASSSSLRRNVGSDANVEVFTQSRIAAG